MFACPRCAGTIDETPRPERCPRCGCSIRAEDPRGLGLDLRVDPAEARASVPSPSQRRRGQARESASDLPMPLADPTGPARTREFVVGEVEGSDGLDLPQPGSLAESSRLRRGGPVAAASASASSRRGGRLSGPWALIGVVMIALAISLGAHWWASAGTERGRSSAPTATELRQIDLNFAADTPEAYQRALVLCEASGLHVCVAEASLLLALRYGPDGVQSAAAATILGRVDDDGDPVLHRVLGLAALDAGDHEEAAWHLGQAQGPRVDLYRGWLAAAIGDRGAAHAAALSVLSQESGNIAAKLLELESRPTLDIVELRRLAEAHPEHPRIQRRLVQALIDEGSLREAQQRADRLRTPARAAPAFAAAGDLLRGEVAERRGEYTRALELYDRAAARLGDLVGRPGERAPARRAADEPAARAEERRALELRRFHLLIAAGDHARLRNELEGVVAERSDDVELLALKIELDLRTGRLHDAEVTLDHLSELEDDGPWAPFLSGLVHAEKVETDEALDDFAAAREADPRFDRAALEEARLLRLLGRPGEALSLIQRQRGILADAGGGPAALRRLLEAELELLLAVGRRSAALALLDGALAADPGDNEARLRRALLRLELGHRSAGRDDLLALRARCGEFPGLVGPLGRLYLDEGREDEAEALVAGITRDPRASDDALLLAAEIRLRRNDLSGAAALADRILLQRPDAWQGHLLRAKLLDARDDPRGALAAIEDARPPSPNPEVELWTGRLLEANGRAGDALAHYREARHLDPSLHEALLRYAALLLEGGMDEAASAELAPLVDAGLGGPAAQRLLARARWLAGEEDVALSILGGVLERDAGDAEAHYWRGVILDDNRRGVRARADLEVAIDGARGASWLQDALRRLARIYDLAGEVERSEVIVARLASLKEP
ncbi:MAG: hypothetical protein R3B09_05370 [Nannocystaceae bacterium]